MESQKTNLAHIAWLIFFSIAMGFLETSVVVYLREIYYPGGFEFPLQTMDSRLVRIELLRELSTVIMLAGIGYLAGRSPNQRLAFFLASFSIWDLSYYLFLKILIGWPESLFTWDILFLIPVPWVGPVLAPCLASVTMLLLAAVFYYRDLQHKHHRVSVSEWIILIAGSAIVIFSWTWDFFNHSALSGNQGNWTFVSDYKPQSYSWWLFALGEAAFLVALYLFWKRTDARKHPAP